MEEEYAYADNQPYVTLIQPEYHPAPYIKINPTICGAEYIVICYGRINECRIRRYLKKIGKLDNTAIHRLNKREYKMCASPLFDYKIEVISVRLLEFLLSKPNNYYKIEYFDPCDNCNIALMYTKFKYFKWFLLHDLEVILGDAEGNKDETLDETYFIHAIKETMKVNLSKDIAKAILEGDGRFKPEVDDEQATEKETDK